MDPDRTGLPQTCRTCMAMCTGDDRMRSIFDADDGDQPPQQQQPELVTMLRTCAGTEIDLGDGLPDRICMPCSNQLQAAFAFRVQCVHSYRTLHALYADRKPIAHLGAPLNADSSQTNEKLDEPNWQLLNVKTDLSPSDDDVADNAVDGECGGVEKTEHDTTVKDECPPSDNTGKITRSSRRTATMIAGRTNPVIANNTAHLPDNDEDEDDDPVRDDDNADPDYNTPDESAVEDDEDDIIPNADDDDQHKAEPVDPAPPSSPPPIKRGRGRPRKHPIPLAAAVATAGNAPRPAKSSGATTTAEQQTFPCPDCDKTFRRHNHMTRHRLIHTDLKPYGCDVCDKRFRRQDHLNIHRHHHAAIKPYPCTQCDHSFTRAQHLQVHVQRRHKVIVLKADGTPDEAAAEAAALAKAATAAANFCTICKRGFSSAKYLIVHQLMHERKHTCKFCGARCKDKEDLAEHSKEHAGDDRPFLCSECGMRFLRNDYLVIHMRRHKGDKPYKCRYCGKGFPRSTDLTVHERYHTGEKSHLCTTCGKGFHRAYNLVVHMRVHTGERPYQCPHCDRGFAQGNDLKAHVRRHTGERYKCDVCGDGFIQGYHLTQHKQRVHGLNVQSHIRRVEKFGGTKRRGGGGGGTTATTETETEQMADDGEVFEVEDLDEEMEDERQVVQTTGEDEKEKV